MNDQLIAQAATYTAQNKHAINIHTLAKSEPAILPVP